MFKYIFLIIIVFFVGCASSNINIEEENKNLTIKEYKDISKNSIFEAAKKVFIFAGKKEFRIDSYRNKLIVTKTKMVHFPFFASTFEDKWDLTVLEENNSSKVTLEVTRITNYEEDKKEYLDEELRELLFSRIEYLLGLTDTWNSCKEHYAYLNLENALCDTTDLSKFYVPTQKDILTNILITDNVNSKSIIEIDDDILNDDIELSIEDSKSDILEKEDKIDIETDADIVDESFDKEIEALDKKINDNIEKTLDKIDIDIQDEVLDDIK